MLGYWGEVLACTCAHTEVGEHKGCLLLNPGQLRVTCPDSYERLRKHWLRVEGWLNGDTRPP